ncbi:L-lactate permease [bioreactor metagenome]|uniref:L-lactate permease n=1 Tax=bioreactor metagenome TaxID=1076179 RepID=A0A644TM11_9ZZZZ|nr:lactate permease LctP family transporter [Negativicutes bacterium]
MTWVQIYSPLSTMFLSALVAAIPLLVLLYMLGIRRSPGHYAAFMGTSSALLLAIVVWKMPVTLAVSSTLYGSLVGIFPIVWIIINAIWIYNMTVESGEFEIIKNSLASITEDRRMQAIFIAFAFGAFIEGTAGFGTPVAITAAMLVGLGFNPIYAAGLCLIANTAPVAFGGIGLPIIVAASVSNLDVLKISQIVGRQLPLISFIVPIWVCVFMSGWKRTMEVLPALLVAGGAFAVTQWGFSNFHGPYLVDIAAATACILALGAFLRVWKPAQIWRFPGEAPSVKTATQYSVGTIFRAWLPYVFIGIIILVWSFPSTKAFLAPFGAKIDWPLLHNLVIKTTPVVVKNTPYAAIYDFNFGATTGTAIWLAGILSVFAIPNYGWSRAIPCYVKTCKQLVLPIVTIATILGLAFLMNYSGMSSTLGLAFTATGSLFPFFSPILGWMGVFLTGSDTSSNALFANMQKTAAEQLGLDPHLTVAANSSGGVVGKMISPQSISVATAATGMVGEEGTIFRFTVVHSIGMIAIIAVMTYLQATALRWMLP